MSQESHSLLQTIGTTLLNAKQPLIVTHKSPDPDAVGSASALHYLLRAHGVVAKLYDQDEVPKNCQFLLDDQVEWLQSLENVEPDVVVLIDCNMPSRAGDAFDAWIEGYAGTTVVLDHHIVTEAWGDLAYVDTKAAAAAQVVADLAAANSWTIDTTAARSMYAGLVADTGSFKHGNTTAEVFELAGLLVQRGVVPNQLTRSLFWTG